MINFIKGQTIVLYEKTLVGTDEWNTDIYEENKINVQNVLICPTSDSDAVDELNLYGKKSVYTLCIPKGDTHTWTDTKVEFFGKVWRTFGDVTEYQEELLPLEWNKKIKVERYE